MKAKKFLTILVCLGMICTMSPVLAASDSVAENLTSTVSVSQTTAEDENVNNNGSTIVMQDDNYDAKISYNDGIYHVYYDGGYLDEASSPTITSNGVGNGSIIIENIHPDEANPHPTIYLNNINLQNNAGSTIDIINSDVTLNIQGDCNLNGMTFYNATINVDESSTLTIAGDGNLNVTSDGYGAAIGANGFKYQPATYTDCSYQASTGNILITGDVHVKSENTGKGAAIGGGYFTSGTIAPWMHGGDINSITINGNACVEAKSTNDSAAVGGGAVSNSSINRPGNLGELNIFDNAKVSATTSSSYAPVGNGMSDLDQIGVINISSTAQLACFSTSPDCNLIPMILQSADQNNNDVNILQGNLSDNSNIDVENNYQIVNIDTNQCVNNISIPTNARSFVITVPVKGHYNIDSLSSWNSSNTINATNTTDNSSFMVESFCNTDSHTFDVDSQSILDGTTCTASSFPTFNIDIKNASMDLNVGDITISQSGDKLNVEQNGITYSIANLLINQPSNQNQPTQNTITIKGNVNASTIAIKDVHMQSSRPIVVEEGANVNFKFIGDNTIVGTDCQQSTDYPAIEVPGGATVTLSGDGSLEATANGYAAAIGTKGYYRDGKDHSDGDKSSGTVQIQDSLNVKAHSAYGAGIGGGAISGSACEQHAFDNGSVIIKGDAVVEALGSTEGGYSAGIGGGGCYTSTCAAVGGDGGDVQILENANVTAACKGSLGTGIGGGGGCGKTADGFGGDGESFKADGNAVVVATGAEYGPGIGGGGAQQKTCCGTHPGNSGSCNVLGFSNVTAQSGGKADNFGIGGHTGGWSNHNGSYTMPVADVTATFNL